jgi:hypothetical protein
VSGRRAGLLVATYEYDDPGFKELRAPEADAKALAQVLVDKEIGDYEVTILVNQPHYVVGEAIGDFYQNCRRQDVTLLYFTGHGLKDDDGRLYFAMKNTRRNSLLFTSLAAEQIDAAMEASPCQQKILILDCCYSGAFPAGRAAKADSAVHSLEKLRGRGRVVLTASDATEYAFEGDRIRGQGLGSVFTKYLVEGMRTGRADLDGDGDISLAELYSYAHDRVIEEIPQQRPKKQEDVEGNIVIGHNINWTLPPYLTNAIGSPIAQDRLAAIEGLAYLYKVGNSRVRSRVMEQITLLSDDDSRSVATAAEQWRLQNAGEAPTAPAPSATPSPVDAKNPAEDEVQAAARTARGGLAAEGPTTPEPVAQPFHESTLDHSKTRTSDEEKPRKNTSSAGRSRTLRRLVVIGAALVALVAIYLIIQLVLGQNSSQQQNNTAQSSAVNGSKKEVRKPLLVDDFHTHAFGWEGPGGGYVNDMYRVDVDPRTRRSTSIPRNPSSVYPSAPSDLRIEVDARSLAPLDDSSGYGVICRLNEGTDERYQFSIGDGGGDTVRITKFTGSGAQALAVKYVASLNATDVNRIRADCSNVNNAAQGAVHLVFSLNGQIVAEATDSDQPLLDGTIGIRVFALGQNGIRAEFDNFVVTPV